MEVPSLYKKIISNPEIATILTWPYDFEVVEPYSIAMESNLKTKEKAIIIAKDGAGGLFALWGCGQVNQLPIVYISSEGQAGKIAKNFNELISIIVSCPFWRDLLKLSDNGQLSEMKRVLPLLESELIEDYPEIENMKERMISTLSLDLKMDPVEKLYEAVVSEPKIIVTSTDGEMFETLFDSFVASDNPMWKNNKQGAYYMFRFQFYHTCLVIKKGDITKEKVDAIVNAANTSLLGGGGVDGAIHRAGGPEVTAECQRIRLKQGGCRVGDAVITGAGQLQAKYVIHTVGPVWNGGNKNEEELLYQAYWNSLKLAKEHDIKTIAFPAISTGIYRFPQELAAEIAIRAVLDFITKHPHYLFEEIRFILFDDKNYQIYEKQICSL